MVEPVNPRSDHETLAVEMPAGHPSLTPAAARVLVSMIGDAARKAQVVKLPAGGSPDEPEAVAS